MEEGANVDGEEKVATIFVSSLLMDGGYEGGGSITQTMREGESGERVRGNIHRNIITHTKERKYRRTRMNSIRDSSKSKPTFLH